METKEYYLSPSSNKRVGTKGCSLRICCGFFEGEGKAIMQETLEITRMKAGLRIAEYSLSSAITI